MGAELNSEQLQSKAYIVNFYDSKGHAMTLTKDPIVFSILEKAIEFVRNVIEKTNRVLMVANEDYYFNPRRYVVDFDDGYRVEVSETLIRD